MPTNETRIATLAVETLRALSLLDDTTQPPLSDLIALKSGIVSEAIVRNYAICGYLDDARAFASQWWDQSTVTRQLW